MKFRIPTLLPVSLLFLGSWVRRIFNAIIRDDPRVSDVFKGTTFQSDNIMKNYKSYTGGIHSGDLKDATDTMPSDFLEGLVTGFIDGYQGPLFGWERDVAILTIRPFRIIESDRTAHLVPDRELYQRWEAQKLGTEAIRLRSPGADPFWTFTEKVRRMLPGFKRSKLDQFTTNWFNPAESNEDLRLRIVGSSINPMGGIRVLRDWIRSKWEGVGPLTKKGIPMSSPISFQVLNASALCLDDHSQGEGESAFYGDDSLRGGSETYVQSFKTLQDRNNYRRGVGKDFTSTDGSSVYTENLFLRGKWVSVTKFKKLAAPKLPGDKDRPMWYSPSHKDAWEQREQYERFRPFFKELRKQGIDLGLPRELGGAGFNLLPYKNLIMRRKVGALLSLPDDEFVRKVMRLYSIWNDVTSPLDRAIAGDISSRILGNLKPEHIGSRPQGALDIKEQIGTVAEFHGGLRVLTSKVKPVKPKDTGPAQLAYRVLTTLPQPMETDDRTGEVIKRFFNLTIIDPELLYFISETERVARFQTAISTI